MMNHEVTSLQTKKILAASLRRLAEEKAFSKITVKEIVSDAGLNRNTFYYHFEDIYSLLKWMLEQETVEVLKQFDLIVDYEEALSFIFQYIENNHRFLQNICHSMGREELMRFFHADFIAIITLIIDETETNEGISVPEDFKCFLSQFYTKAIAGTLLDWITQPSAKNQEQIIRYISETLRTALPGAMKAMAQ